MSKFECELTSEMPDADYEPNPYFRNVTRPSFKLTKTAPCIVRYEAEPDDGLTLARLRQELKTPFDVANHLATIEEATRTQDRLDYFSKLLGKTQKGTIDFLDDMKYVETTDSYALHARAEYIYDNGELQQNIPCKVGEPLVIKLDPETLTFKL